jgi:hypothetical protein
MPTPRLTKRCTHTTRHEQPAASSVRGTATGCVCARVTPRMHARMRVCKHMCMYVRVCVRICVRASVHGCAYVRGAHRNTRTDVGVGAARPPWRPSNAPLPARTPHEATQTRIQKRRSGCSGRQLT